MTRVANGKEPQGSVHELQVLRSIEAQFKSKAGDINRYTKESANWFRNYIPRAYNRMGANQLFQEQKLHRNDVQLGKLYFFQYDALWKDKLNNWDAFPMIFPFSKYRSKDNKEIILGLNVHWLPPKQRMLMFIALLKFRNESRYRKSTRLQLEWQLLKSMSESKYFSQAVHAYRVDHVKSPFVEIPSQSWEMAIFLPVDKFQKGSRQSAWRS